MAFYHPPDFYELHNRRRTKWQEIQELDYVGIFLYTAGLLIFLMGLSWGGVLEGLSETFQVFAPDLLGYRKSASPDIAYSTKRHVAVIESCAPERVEFIEEIDTSNPCGFGEHLRQRACGFAEVPAENHLKAGSHKLISPDT